MVAQVLEQLRKSERQRISPFGRLYRQKPAEYCPFPLSLNPRIAELLQGKGINMLYTHRPGL